MKFNTIIFSIFCLELSIPLIYCQDTIFAKGGTCMYKISDHWKRCMDQQNVRLTNERDKLQPIYTRAALTESLNRISCCAYWDFLLCIEEAASKYCPNEKSDMIAYSRQLGSAVPSEICQESFHSEDCNEYYTSSSSSIIGSLTTLLILFFFIFSVKKILLL